MLKGQLEEVLRPGDQAGEEALLTVPSEQQLTKVRGGTPAPGTMCQDEPEMWHPVDEPA